ncbi:MAG: hypothetical protein PHP35_01615 [Candidatus Colwellbacteria bacterium]|nr:hypothetical protein [Candidatus Colwellbacteria bacterium]
MKRPDFYCDEIQKKLFKTNQKAQFFRREKAEEPSYDGQLLR